MKRKWMMLMSGALCLCLLSGCGGETVDAPSDESESHSAPVNERIETMTDVPTTGESAVETEPDAEPASNKTQNTSNGYSDGDRTPSNPPSQTPDDTPVTPPAYEPEQPPAQDPVTPPSNDRLGEYRQKIDAENERHEKAIEEAEAYCEYLVASYEDQIDDLRWEHDVYNGSYDSYTREMQQLDNEISRLQERISLLSRDSSGIYAKEVERLEKELDAALEEKRTLKLSWTIKDMIEDLENEIEIARSNLAQTIREENELHEKNIEEINQQYGM